MGKGEVYAVFWGRSEIAHFRNLCGPGSPESVSRGEGDEAPHFGCFPGPQAEMSDAPEDKKNTNSDLLLPTPQIQPGLWAAGAPQTGQSDGCRVLGALVVGGCPVRDMAMEGPCRRAWLLPASSPKMSEEALSVGLRGGASG